MAVPWFSGVKTAKKLTVFAGPNVTGGAWNSVFSNAVQEFNTLSKSFSLGVALVISITAPDPKGPGGADVQFEAAGGPFTYNFADPQGQPQTGTGQLNGNGLN